MRYKCIMSALQASLYLCEFFVVSTHIINCTYENIVEIYSRQNESLI